MKQFSDELLRTLRNDVSVATVLTVFMKQQLVTRQGVVRFVCPQCKGMHTGINQPVNLARCFDCKKNYNPIDFVMVHFSCSFKTAVRTLLQFYMEQNK